MTTTSKPARRITSRDMKRMVFLRGQAKSPKHSAFMAAIKRRQIRGLKKRRLAAQLKPTAASTIAAARAFEVVELMENILLHLPPADMIRSRRVATQWHAVFQGSAKLQRTPTPYPPPTHVPEFLGFESDGWACFPVSTSDIDDFDPSHRAPIVAARHPTPVLQLHPKHPGTSKLQALTVNLEGMLRWDTSGAWTTHQLTQPPTKDVHFLVPEYGVWTIHYESGVTLGHVRDYLAEIKKKHGLKQWAKASILLVGVYTEDYELVHIARWNTERPEDKKGVPIREVRWWSLKMHEYLHGYIGGTMPDGLAGTLYIKSRP